MTEKIIKFFKNRIDYISLIAVIVISLFLNLLSIGNQFNNHIVQINTLDFSWTTDIVERFLHGEIAGRDFIFTYGPLYQLIHSLPSLLFNLPSYESHLYVQLFLIIPITTLIFYISKLISSDKKEHTLLFLYLYFIVGLISFSDQSTLFRITAPVVYVLLYIKFTFANKKFSLKNLTILSLPALLGLYSFDLFLFNFLLTFILITFTIFSLYYPSLNKSKEIKGVKKLLTLKKIVFNGIFQLSLIIVFELVISLLFSHNFNYLFYSLDTAKNYQFMGNIPWTINKPYILFLFPLSLLFVFIYFLKNTTNGTLKQTGIVLTITALLGIRTGFFRTDEAHILFGVYTSIIVVFILLFFIARKNGINLFVIMFFIPLYLLIPFKQNIYSTISAKDLVSAISHLNHPISFFELYKFSDKYYYKNQDFQYFASLIQNNPRNVMIYPTDIYILNVYNQTYNTLPVLFHDASNTLVEKEAVNRLSKSPPKYIILGIDAVSAVALDDIPNFSKNPYLAKWMISNYSVYQDRKNYLILQFDQKKQLNKQLLKENASDEECNIYDIDTTHIMQGDIIENYFKPSSFYFENKNATNISTPMHLPYHADTKSILIVDNYTNPEEIKKLFDRNINFDKYTIEEKTDIKIIKKYFFPKLSKTFTGPFSVKCY